MHAVSVNIARPRSNPWKSAAKTGIDKRPVTGPVAVSAPDSPSGSGAGGDFIGDREHHGGPAQAVYAYASEDYGFFSELLGRDLGPGRFGENLTTEGVDLNSLVLGQRIRVGPSVVLEATGPRIPCGTFRGWMDVPGWLKTFTAEERPGTYFAVAEAGEIRAGDAITVLGEPGHGVTVARFFRAYMRDREELRRIAEPPGLPEYTKQELAEALNPAP
ncbi:MOSC domain-containing protein [Salininema proteolyticum]|uniref:MOSC domain-containing protein n=1 Tax=Salininema proteolyticum TaxID=1607685 RepID=A0ABV8TZS1_9ACTN